MTYPYNAPSPYPQYGQYPMPPRYNGMAIASMVVSLVGMISCYGALIICPVGAILGHVAQNQIKKSPQQSLGGGMALTGILVGWIVFGIWLLLLTFVILAATGVLGPDLQRGFD
ncbi:DUF4190 domain-containing protein [Saccharopolyspora taberi]|uniref:DUF4190 domain-containing protein n=1 Tax=Saccharopolyspora taberi TaxID=60895 RepID=A0ABN3V395_9PSEU